jgi:membrane protease YdiL (CAAX protease family)
MTTIEAMVRRPGSETQPGREARAEAGLSMPRILALHLIPGALMTGAFVALAPAAEAMGLPPIAALLASIMLVLVPVELGIVLWTGRGQAGALSAIPFRRPIPVRTWLWLVPALIVLAFVGFGVHMGIEPALIDQLFGWVPAWFVSPIQPERVTEYSRSAWALTIGAYLVINGLVGPIVEELYFRGYLLPRMERFGRWAPLLNVSLFSLYHFWSPWQLVARILAIGPMVYAVRWTRNVYLGMVVHCSLNTLGVILVATMVFGRL